MSDMDDLQRRCVKAEAERLRLKQLNSALRKQVEAQSILNISELTPVSRGFLSSDERLQHVRQDADTSDLWKGYASNTLGLNKRYRIYIGYLYERMGWEVDYSGGKYLVSKRENKTIVTLAEAISTIALSNMYTLLGMAMDYAVGNPHGHVSAMCMTSSTLVSRVINLASKFNIAVREHFYFRNFPCVRCKAYSEVERIYYVPDDEEYLSVNINPAEGDRYCWSTDEAEAMRFYRPY